MADNEQPQGQQPAQRQPIDLQTLLRQLLLGLVLAVCSAVGGGVGGFCKGGCTCVTMPVQIVGEKPGDCCPPEDAARKKCCAQCVGCPACVCPCPCPKCPCRKKAEGE
jgi:hypothetical protein